MTTTTKEAAPPSRGTNTTIIITIISVFVRLPIPGSLQRVTPSLFFLPLPGTPWLFASIL